VFALGGAPASVSSQVRLRDLVFTAGGSVERYSGNFSSVTVPVVDSTNSAAAAVGEFSARGRIVFLQDAKHGFERLGLAFDGGLRQSAAVGFTLRDYAPREWVGNVDAWYQESLGTATSLRIQAGIQGRSVTDRPPMPLFLQPGHSTLTASATVFTRAGRGALVDATIDVERADYAALAFLPQLDLLDRTGAGVELGASWGGASTLRFYTGMRWTSYRHQGSFDPRDPFRRDRTVRAGLDWRYGGSGIFAELGMEGTVNRSNSDRPEYDAVSVRGLFSASLPADFSLNLFALLTQKSYVRETEFARLVPGEEADNASLAYLQLTRPLATNLDGAIRLGWTRAETDIGNAYYQRTGFSFRLNYRPNGH